jgi:hypothetical protein
MMVYVPLNPSTGSFSPRQESMRRQIQSGTERLWNKCTSIALTLRAHSPPLERTCRACEVHRLHSV